VDPITTESTNQAATRIQALWRGWSTRDGIDEMLLKALFLPRLDRMLKVMPLSPVTVEVVWKWINFHQTVPGAFKLIHLSELDKRVWRAAEAMEDECKRTAKDETHVPCAIRVSILPELTFAVRNRPVRGFEMFVKKLTAEMAKIREGRRWMDMTILDDSLRRERAAEKRRTRARKRIQRGGRRKSRAKARKTKKQNQKKKLTEKASKLRQKPVNTLDAVCAGMESLKPFQQKREHTREREQTQETREATGGVAPGEHMGGNNVLCDGMHHRAPGSGRALGSCRAPGSEGGQTKSLADNASPQDTHNPGRSSSDTNGSEGMELFSKKPHTIGTQLSKSMAKLSLETRSDCEPSDASSDKTPDQISKNNDERRMRHRCRS
jgi:hypothetical protein